MNSKISRRKFLQHSGALGGVSALGIPIALNLAAMANAAAAASLGGDYKALVCVFLSGGNDAYNTVPYTSDSPSWARYSEARPTTRLSAADILPLALSTGPKLGLHPSLVNLHRLFQQQKVAIVGNVGPLTKPIDRTAYLSGSAPRPPRLFSHNDQSAVWQSGAPEGHRSGWGGRAAALQTEAGSNEIDGVSNQLFTSIGVETTASFSSTMESPYVSAFGASQNTGALQPGGEYTGQELYETKVKMGPWLDPVLGGVGQKGISDGKGGAAGHLIEKDYLTKSQNAVLAWQKLKASFNAVSMPAYAKPGGTENDLAEQLYMVAKFIKARNAPPLAMKRQVFFVQLGGFDTHDNQLSQHAALLSRLDEALSYFQELLGDDVNRVTTFTASEFGRKLSQNNDGTDHGWGGHHFVLGGSQVAGGQVYGHFPDLSSWNPNEYGDLQLLRDGTMIPKVSVDQFGYQLAKWFGVPDGKMLDIFENYQAPADPNVSVSFMR